MHSESNARANVDHDGQALELTDYGNGHALLRPETPRFVLTDLGRRALAEAALFGPWPTVAEAVE